MQTGKLEKLTFFAGDSFIGRRSRPIPPLRARHPRLSSANGLFDPRAFFS
jgi:hypothetical protein